MDAPIVELAAITIDCADVGVMAEFYGRAFGAEVTHRDESGAWVHLPGGPILLPRFVDDYRRPSWPSNETPMQIHLELWVDDLDDTEAWLCDLGATVAPVQPLREHGNVVMFDPAGHPFCIGTRARSST